MPRRASASDVSDPDGENNGEGQTNYASTRQLGRRALVHAECHRLTAAFAPYAEHPVLREHLTSPQQHICYVTTYRIVKEQLSGISAHETNLLT